MLFRRWMTIALASGISLTAAACAKRAQAPESNAPPAQGPAEGAPPPPAGYGQPGGQPGSMGGEAAPGSNLGDGKSRDDGYSTLADAEQAFERAQSELGTLVGSTGGKDKTSSTTSPSKPGAPPAATKPDTSAAPLAQGDTRCAQACKAFASLRRAADGVCRLAGDGDARCARARGVVRDNETRVAACKCDAGG